ncbi:MAG TPA: hypothetical protein VF528_14410 [Pyrinomonadaceae bacterium]
MDYQDGIDELTDRFTLKDINEAHPIRPQLMGRPTIYFVVADGEGELLCKASGEYHVQTATSSLGMVHLRRQIQRYHYPPEEEGKPVGQMQPRKIDDDLVNDLGAFATHRWPSQPQMTEEERRLSKLSDHLKPKALKAPAGYTILRRGVLGAAGRSASHPSAGGSGRKSTTERVVTLLPACGVTWKAAALSFL